MTRSTVPRPRRCGAGSFRRLDWGERHDQVHALDGGSTTRLSFRVPHDRSGLEGLRPALAGLGIPSEVGVAIERRDGLLVDHLLAWRHPAYPVNLKVAARAREEYRATPVKGATRSMRSPWSTSFGARPRAGGRSARRPRCMLSCRRSSVIASASSSSTGAAGST